MASLRFRILPYLMVPGGLVLVLFMIPVLMRGAETSPTTAAIADVSVGAPDARWLNITGGGLYLPDAVADESVHRRTGVRKTKAWYVPLIPESEAVDRALAVVQRASTTSPSTPQKLILVRFQPDEFQRNYPTPENLKPDDVFRPVDVQGTRASNAIFPSRLKDYIRDELKMPVENVVVIHYGSKPIQRGPAALLVLGGIVLALLGVLWIRKRWRRAPAPVPPPPLPPLP